MWDPIKRPTHAVAELIMRGHVLMVYKVKHGTGKELVSVGPYRTAVPSNNKYALIIGRNEYRTFAAYNVAREFTSWVGMDIAREVIRKARGSEARGEKATTYNPYT